MNKDGRNEEREYETKEEEGRYEQEKAQKGKKEVGVNRWKRTINPLISFTSLIPKVKYIASKWNYLHMH